MIDNDQLAEQALQELANEKAEGDRILELCQAQICFYEQQADKAHKAYEYKKNILLGDLHQYFDTVPHKATKTQETYKLASGSLVRKFEKKNMVCDTDKLMKALNDTEYVILEPKLAWGEYKKTLTIVDDVVVDPNGEVIDGVNIETVLPTFEIKF